VGKAFTYSRAFGRSEVKYTPPPPTVVNESEIDLDLQMSQTYSNLEDEAHNLVKDEKDAIASVTNESGWQGRCGIRSEAWVDTEFLTYRPLPKVV